MCDLLHNASVPRASLLRSNYAMKPVAKCFTDLLQDEGDFLIFFFFFTVCLLTFRSDLATHVRVLPKLVLDAEKMCLYNVSHPQLCLQEIVFKWYKLIFIITV